ncbi:MAG: 3-oxoacyl-[acyl-carrier-protein] reductase [Candidatus Omnitrophica bacterium]|nr:3-oxoacyl-[acyl-carrier-protein] reductase [Candidatus Omnitrophota bacterium]
MKELKGKTAIITGGSRGIGRACCSAFASAGANVVFTYNKSKKEAEELSKEIEAQGVRCLALQSDVKDYEQCKKVVATAYEKFSDVDILVNNAGIVRDKALMMMLPEDWKEVIDTNLGGTFNMTRAIITNFLKVKKGCIINMSSVSGLVGIPRQTNYSAAKAGIIGFSKALAKEVAAYNVRVNAVCPGYIETDMVKSLREDVKQEIVKYIPAKKIGKPEEVAQLCVFLASDKAPYMTGNAIRIDGGLAT